MEIARKDFRLADFDALTDLWNRFYPKEFAIDVHLLRQNTVESSLFDWGASLISYREGKPVAFVAIKRSASRLYQGPEFDTCHITCLAFEEAEEAINLLAQVKLILRSRGITKLVFGQDSRHFFPGCPDSAKVLKSFLMVEGFEESGKVYDLESDLTTYSNPAETPKDGEYRMLMESDREGLLKFLLDSFPGRWRYDVLEKAAVEGLSETVFGLLINGKVEGFSLLQTWPHRKAIGGAVWRNSLGEHWGSLGPIGISEGIRGKGFGNALLGKSLEHLKEIGVHKCIIDWTGLVEFYGKHGFKVTRTYYNLSLALD